MSKKLKELKSVDVTVAFCDTGWGQQVATISIPIGGTEEELRIACLNAVPALYGAAKRYWEIEEGKVRNEVADELRAAEQNEVTPVEAL